MVLPNFLVIGGMRCGTTSLYYYLRQHPEIFLSRVKETHFFSSRNFLPVAKKHFWIKSPLEKYADLFKNASTEKAIGEVCTTYLYVAQSARRIYNYLPNVKLIAIIRNPVDRAYSHFNHRRQLGLEPIKDFSEALSAEKERIRQGLGMVWYYQDTGFYYSQLKRYFDAFPREQIKVCLFEELQSNPSALMKKIYSFLEVDDDFSPDTSVRYNMSGMPVNPLLRSLYILGLAGSRCARGLLIKQFIPFRLKHRFALAQTKLLQKNIAAPALSPEIRKQLTEVFRNDILQLQDLLQTDLGHWLK